MLQQTQVDTVIPYYHRFLRQFPTIEALAKASLQEVLKAWENMGYYARARHLHAAAQEVVKRMGGKVPNTWDELIALPGIGTYTASAILSFAFDKRFPTVDGNAQRVLCRLPKLSPPKTLPISITGSWSLGPLSASLGTLCVMSVPSGTSASPSKRDCRKYYRS
jgi:A/G-specific adenine glycosylase